MTLALLMLTIVAVMPFLALAHELGHSVVGLAMTRGPVRTVVGRTPSLIHLQLGRLSLELNPVFARNAPGGFCVVDAPYSSAAMIASLLGGPAANLLIAAAFVPVFLGAQGDWRVVAGAIAYASAAVAFITLWPGHFAGYLMDGAKARDAWRSRRTPTAESTFQAIRRRCVALYTTPSAEIRTDSRWHRLQYGTRMIAGREAPADFAQLTFIGWCWRHAEGDTQSAPPALREAHATVTARDLQPERVAADVALRFLADGGDPTQGSPGATPEARAALFGRARDAYAQAAAAHPAGLSLDVARSLFTYGVVLHDAERLVT